MITIERCGIYANFFGLIAFLMGIITGYYSMAGEDNLMFVPLVIGMVFVGLMFWAIMKRGDLKYGKPVDKY